MKTTKPMTLAVITAAGVLAAARAGAEAPTTQPEVTFVEPPMTSQRPHGSLFKQGLANVPPAMPSMDPNHPITPAGQVSYFAVPSAEQRKFRKHDLVTIVIREDSQGTSSGKGTSKKQQDFDAALEQWVQLGGSSVTSVKNPSKLPEIKFNFKNNRDNQADQTRSDSFSARITAEIVDVKPNGNVVLQAVKHIEQDKEVQDFKLSGECRASDVAADNSVLSTQLADLRFEKKTTGEVRDGTKRGWLNGLFDKVNPF